MESPSAERRSFLSQRMARLDSARRRHGFSLIEVLVAVLVVAVGVLGVAGLQLVTMRANTGSMMRTQANEYAYSIIDRMRANRGANYQIAMNASAPVAADCSAAACSTDQMAAFDLANWLAQVAQLPSGDGSVAVAANVVTVTLQWDDDNDPNNALTTMVVRTQLVAP